LNAQVAPASHWSEQWPAEQSILHVAPLAHARRQLPDEQATLHVPPFGHEVLHPPDEQSSSHWPAPQYVAHLPLEQSSVQGPDAGQVRPQPPAEHAVMQGEAVHAAVQRPLGHVQDAALHIAALRDPAAAVSGIAGPPLGEEPDADPVLDDELPQAIASKRRVPNPITRTIDTSSW